jgi:hypothetical protein
MPKQGHLSVTIKVYLWDQFEAYYNAHKKELRDKGVKSPTGLITYCLEHYDFEKLFQES